VKEFQFQSLELDPQSTGDSFVELGHEEEASFSSQVGSGAVNILDWYHLFSVKWRSCRMT